MKFCQVLIAVFFILSLSIARADDEDKEQRKRIETYQLNLLKHFLDLVECELEFKHYEQAVERMLRIGPKAFEFYYLPSTGKTKHTELLTDKVVLKYLEIKCKGRLMVENPIIQKAVPKELLQKCRENCIRESRQAAKDLKLTREQWKEKMDLWKKEWAYYLPK